METNTSSPSRGEGALDHAGLPSGLRTAVLLPCQNEAPTVAQVVLEFRAALPHAVVYVYDNASDDGTAERARTAGAIVRRERRAGKGFVIGRMFADVEADVYVIADGDGTYDPAAAPRMIQLLIDDNLDMVVGKRRPTPDSSSAYPRGHVLGNRLFTRMLAALFGRAFTDVFSGYRVLSRRLAKSFPVRSTGFEIETELTTHALDLGVPSAEVETSYRPRQEGSQSKLRTWRDALRILKTTVLLYKELRPMRFFGSIAAVLTALALGLGIPVVGGFIRTGLVPRFPTAILAASIQIVAFICLTAGIILDSVSRSRRETKQLAYLALPALTPIEPEPPLVGSDGDEPDERQVTEGPSDTHQISLRPRRSPKR